MLPLNESWHVANAIAYIPQWPIVIMISCKKMKSFGQPDVSNPFGKG